MVNEFKFTGDNVILGLTYRLLINEYAIKRIKYKNRFKRAIIIDGVPHYISSNNTIVKSKLISELTTLYDVSSDDVGKLLNKLYGF